MVNIEALTAPLTQPTADARTEKQTKILDRAREFESVFVAQMLKYSGLEKAISGQGGFGGEAYSGLLLEQYANKIVQNGGFGLTEHIYEQLLEREGG